MLSRATSRHAIKLVNFDPNDIKVNTSALAEITRMRSEANFAYNPFQLQTEQCPILLAHLNIRSLQLHAIDLQHDICMKYLTLICLSETHIKHELPLLPGFSSIATTSQHGLAIYIKEQYEYTELAFSDLGIQIIGILLTNNDSLYPIVLTYKPPLQPQHFFYDSLQSCVQELLHTHTNIIIIGDFNTPLDSLVLKRFLQNNRLIQIIDQPTHILGNTLDFFITTFSDIKFCVRPVPYSDHSMIISTIC